MRVDHVPFWERRWPRVLMAALLCAPGIVAFGIHRWLLHTDLADQRAPIHQLDLLAGSPPLPPHARFVWLSGQPVVEGIVRYEGSGLAGSGHTTTIVPVVPLDWIPERAVQYLLSVDAPAGSRWFFESAAPEMRTLRSFASRLDAPAANLPVLVRRRLAATGVRLAPDCRVLRSASFRDGKVASRAESQAWWLIPWLGGGLSALLLMVAGAFQLQRPRRAPPAVPLPSGEPVYPSYNRERQ